MKLLMIGDIVSQSGCDYLRKVLNKYKTENNIDMVIANGENSAVGNGIIPRSANHIFDSGVDVITTGNHVFKRPEMLEYLDSCDTIIRPANYYNCEYGKGWCIYDFGRFSVGVINLQGRVYMDNIDCPFQCIDKILPQLNCKYIIVDFHAEATSEKLALAHYCDGRVSCFAGTHTHVQTSDAMLLPNKTAYITDLGMTGPINSVLGVKSESVITKFIKGTPTRFEPASGECKLEGIVVTFDDNTSQATDIKSIRI